VAGLHVHPAVALALGGVDAERGRVTQGIVVAARHAERAVVADREFALRALGIARAPGHDVDHAGGGVLAEHRALRALQYLDALDLAEVAEADAVARPVDAVDHDTDRGFQAHVVADRTDAADAGGGDRLALGTGHGEAGHQDLHV